MSGLTKIERLAVELVANLNSPELTQRAADLRAALEAKAPGAIVRATARRQARRENERFGRTPPWARRLITKYARPSNPTVTWNRRRGTMSSGHCNWRRIHITEGTDRTDARYVLLHEIAHWNDTELAHGPTFYDELARLARAEGLLRYGTGRDSRNLKAAIRRQRGTNR